MLAWWHKMDLNVQIVRWRWEQWRLRVQRNIWQWEQMVAFSQIIGWFSEQSAQLVGIIKWRREHSDFTSFYHHLTMRTSSDCEFLKADYKINSQWLRVFNIFWRQPSDKLQQIDCKLYAIQWKMRKKRKSKVRII